MKVLTGIKRTACPWTSQQHNISSRSISVPGALALLHSKSLFHQPPIFTELFFLPPGHRLICLHSNSEREPSIFKNIKSALLRFVLTCWDWSTHLSFPPSLHSIFLSLSCICCLSFSVLAFCQFIYYIFFYYYSLSASRDPFRVLCNLNFSTLIHWELFNLPICCQCLRGNHIKEMNNMFLLNTVPLFLFHCHWWLQFSKL